MPVGIYCLPLSYMTGCLLCGIFELEQPCNVFLLDVLPNPNRNRITSLTYSGHYILMTSVIASGKRDPIITDSINLFDAFTAFVVIDVQFNCFTILRTEVNQFFIILHLQIGWIVVYADIEEIVESDAMGLIAAVVMAVKAGDIAFSPVERHHQDKGLKGFEVIKVELIFKGIEERF